MNTTGPLLGLLWASLIIFVATLVGGLIPSVFSLTHTRLQVGVSFSAGLMLGLAILGMLPHAMLSIGNVQMALNLIVVGFLVTFFLQRVFQFHKHEVDVEHHPCTLEGDHPTKVNMGRHLAWLGVLLGLILHSVMDGVAVGASISLMQLGHGSALGIGTTLAVVLHKPFDAFALATLLAFCGVGGPKRLAVNLFFAAVTPVSAILFYSGVATWVGVHSVWLGYALAFCAGTFLCIACSDLLPELQFHKHDRIVLSVALGLGVGVAVLISTICHKHHSHPTICPHSKVHQMDEQAVEQH